MESVCFLFLQRIGDRLFPFSFCEACNVHQERVYHSVDRLTTRSGARLYYMDEQLQALELIRDQIASQQ